MRMREGDVWQAITPNVPFHLSAPSGATPDKGLTWSMSLSAGIRLV